MAVEDISKKEEKKKEEEEKKEKQVGWFQKVPIVFKVLAVVFLYIQYQRIVSAGGKIQEMYTWIILTVIVLYFMGKEGVRRETGVLTPEEAMDALNKEIRRMIKSGQIDRWTKYWIGPNAGLFNVEGVPQHYQIGVNFLTNNGREYKKGIVFSSGNTRGYAVIQDHPGRFKGTEVVSVRTPKFFKDIRKYGVDWDKMIFGEKK